MERTTPKPSPESPENIVFTADEARLCTKALAYFTSVQLAQDKSDSDQRAFYHLTNTADRASQSIDGHAQFIYKRQSLARKFTDAAERPNEAIILEPAEMITLGDALFEFGKRGSVKAEAVMNDSSFHADISDKDGDAKTKIALNTQAAERLHFQLGAIAVDKPIVIDNWADWQVELFAPAEAE